MSGKKNTSIVWFRNNLRVEDNLALYNAVNQSDKVIGYVNICLLYTSPSPRDYAASRMPSSA